MRTVIRWLRNRGRKIEARYLSTYLYLPTLRALTRWREIKEVRGTAAGDKVECLAVLQSLNLGAALKRDGARVQAGGATGTDSRARRMKRRENRLWKRSHGRNVVGPAPQGSESSLLLLRSPPEAITEDTSRCSGPIPLLLFQSNPTLMGPFSRFHRATKSTRGYFPDSLTCHTRGSPLPLLVPRIAQVKTISNPPSLWGFSPHPFELTLLADTALRIKQTYT